MSVPTSFFCFFVSGFPDFVSSGGGIGGSGTTIDDEAFSACSISGSRIDEWPSCRDSPSVKYAGGSVPGFSGGRSLC